MRHGDLDFWLVNIEISWELPVNWKVALPFTDPIYLWVLLDILIVCTSASQLSDNALACGASRSSPLLYTVARNCPHCATLAQGHYVAMHSSNPPRQYWRFQSAYKAAWSNHVASYFALAPRLFYFFCRAMSRPMSSCGVCPSVAFACCVETAKDTTIVSAQVE